MKFATYPRTKPSGVEWINGLPENWEAKQLSKAIIGIKDGTHGSFDRVPSRFPLLSAKNVTNNGVVLGDNESSISEEDNRSIIRCGYPRRNDLLITIVGTIGRSCVYEFDAPVSFQRSVAFLRFTRCSEPKFFAYQVQSKFFQEQLQVRTKSAAQGGVYLGDLVKCPVFAPPLKDQRVIVKFLDQETEQLDQLVAKKQELIERLNEKRTALISRCVTRGLPPAAALAAGFSAKPPLKHASPDWLGDTPRHWDVKAIKWESPVKRGASPRPIDDERFFDDDGKYAWVRIADVTAAGPYLEKTEQRMSPLGSSLSVKLNPGALFLSIAGTVGKPCITKINCCIHDGFVYFPRWKGDTKFLFYIFASGEPYKGLGKMGTQLNLNTDTVGSIKVGLPPIPEQVAISAYLDLETAKLDALVSKVGEAVERLEEYRNALITAAVTGRIDVRAVASV